MKVVLLGSGNVATHLGRALKQAGHDILQVWSRTKRNAEELAGSLNAQATDRIEELTEEAEIYILSVSDDAISELGTKFPFRDKLLIHTSGTTDLDALNSASTKIGVFYPLQTFSKQRSVDFRVIPIAIEGRTKDIEDDLLSLASSISSRAVVFDSEKRKALHVAAVFACNFSNHLYTLAHQVLTDKGLDFDLIRPLIAETSNKVQGFLPFEVQTGPAVRNDKQIVNKHIEYLSEKPDLRELYEKLSQNIINFYQKP